MRVDESTRHEVVIPREIMEHELANDNLTVGTYRALAQRQHLLGPVSFDVALRTVCYLHVRNRDRPFRLDYEFAVVDIVLRAFRWYDFDIQRAFNALVFDWLLCYEHFAADNRGDCASNGDATRRALTNAFKA